MPPTPAGPLTHEPAPAAPPFAASRWPVLALLILPAIWLERRVVRILANAEPLENARHFLRHHACDIVALAACAAAWFVVRRHNEGRQPRLSYLAVCATLLALLNPFVVSIFFRIVGFNSLTAPEPHAFRALLVAAVVGAVAQVRIALSRGSLKGSAFGSAAVAIGVGGLLLIIALVVLFICGMAAFGPPASRR